MPFYPERKRFQPLQQQEGVEGRYASAGVSQQLHTGFCDVGQRAQRFGVLQAVVAGVRLGEGGELAARCPVKLASVHDDAANGRAVAAYELGGGMNDDVRAIFDGADEVGGAKGVVNNQRDAVFMGNGGYFLDIDQIDAGVANGLNIKCLGFGADGCPKVFGIIGVYKRRLDAIAGEGVGKQVMGAAVKRAGRHDVVAGFGNVEYGIGNSG